MTTRKDIESVLWAACDVLRGSIDASQYKDYILTLLFIKYVSDTYREQRDGFLEKYGHDETRADFAMQRAARFKVPEVSRFGYLHDNRRGLRIGTEEKGIGELIDQGLEELQAANPGKLSSPDGGSIFQNISFNSSNAHQYAKPASKRATGSSRPSRMVDFACQPAEAPGWQSEKKPTFDLSQLIRPARSDHNHKPTNP